MPKRILIVVAGAILCAGGFAVAQNPQTEIRIMAEHGMVKAGKVNIDPKLLNKLGVANQASGRITLINVSIQANGVLVRADRAVVNQREVTLEGNVRMTLPPPK